MKTKIFTLLFVLAYISTACSGAATPAPTATETPTPPPPTDAPSPAPAEQSIIPDQTSQFLTIPIDSCCNGKAIEAGIYETPPWFGIPITVEVGEGWRAVNDKEALLFMLGKGRNIYNDPVQALIFILVPNGNAQAILTSIARETGLTQMSEITEITIAGFPGLQLDLSAKPNPEYQGDKEAEILPGSQFLPVVNKYFAPGFIWTTWTPESRLRFIVLNVEEYVLLLEIDSPPAEFEAFAGEADQVLQTLKLKN